MEPQLLSIINSIVGLAQEVITLKNGKIAELDAKYLAVLQQLSSTQAQLEEDALRLISELSAANGNTEALLNSIRTDLERVSTEKSQVEAQLNAYVEADVAEDTELKRQFELLAQLLSNELPPVA